MDEKKITDLLYKKFVGKDFKWRPNILGIYYANGYMQATNGFILAKVHFEEYDFEMEERIVAEDGSYIGGSFPDFEKLLTENLEEPETMLLGIFKACKKLPEATHGSEGIVALEIEGAHFNAKYLKAIFELFELIRELPKMQTVANSNQKVLVFKSSNCSAICVSTIQPISTKDILFSIDEAIEFNLSQSK